VDIKSSLYNYSQRFFSLRWKILISISFILVVINGFLAWYAYQQLMTQFTADQAQLRARQSEQLHTLFDDRYQQLLRLANILLLLAPSEPTQDIVNHLQNALNLNGSLLDIEWDIRSVHWLDSSGQTTLLWPQTESTLPASLVQIARQHPEQISTLLVCEQDCRQYLAAPLLWQGQVAGALILSRLVADTLLTFKELTGADVALTTSYQQDSASTKAIFPALTNPSQTLDILNNLSFNHLHTGTIAQAFTLSHGQEWFSLFEISLTHNHDGLSALILNRVTAYRNTIDRIVYHGLFIGGIGLLVAELLLLLLMHNPLKRIGTLSQLLPLLAENRFSQLAQQLPDSKTHIVPWRDEIDAMVTVVATLNERMHQIQAEREAAQGRLIWLANHDELTQLANRRYFNAKLQNMITESIENNTTAALFFFDLDRFKDVNDTSGHHIGDLLLQKIAQRLNTHFNTDNTILGRFGGDEFALLVPKIHHDQIDHYAQQLQEIIGDTQVQTPHHRHQLSASIGIVLIPQHGTEIEMLMVNADLAMYQAKATEAGSYHLFSDQDDGRTRADARLFWASRIKDALKEQRFELHYQPIQEINTQSIWRAEALIRMRSHDDQLIYPNIFIPIAEETGLVRMLDDWCIRTAIQTLQHYPNLYLSVNLSAEALKNEQLPLEIDQLLRDYQVEPKRLTLEITETLAINSLAQAAKLMQAIQELGCHFALDDFGSGFASYSYLKQLPVNDVKIDGAFVRDLHHNREDYIFVHAITEMSHSMGKRVIAEYVESIEIFNLLKALGVDFAQGYYIAKPQNASILSSFVARTSPSETINSGLYNTR
jgi:diguanylate cyclase (GGDEF)-like protein